MLNNSDTALTTFNSKGKLLQVEYAKRAVSLSHTIIAVKTKQNAIIGTKINQITKSEFPFFGTKIFIINKKMGMGGTGMYQDIKILVKKARNHAKTFKQNFGEEISLRQIVRDLACFIQEFTQTGGVRPFGASLILIGFEKDGPDLYKIDPSGSFEKIKACALGKKEIPIKNFLQKRVPKELNFLDALNLILLAFTSIENDNSDSDIQIGILSNFCSFKILSFYEIKKFLGSAPKIFKKP
ncbi:prsA2 (nucleomorph) [Hemiselmis andersenii]|uniref:PrsA2 n=1 Tax=Hemiselmis andersenii TaxID=464988 RepID=A9BLA2_HEMAN|nr:prsA2 [Hemiselmis andersenii]ABW98285.1 prsA2 [Hemiselmis andersenii]|mmetsp:Transcript_10053/g.23519  ORF Transcript_10053/g.23519 Transcript_10053/m.23519 type:complete len:240 (-) Transcript_10053:1119-1838(-)